MERSDRKRHPRAQRKGFQDSKKPKGPDAREKLNYIAGFSAVEAVFEKSLQSVDRLYFDDTMKVAASPFCAAMVKLRKSYRLVGREELAKIAGTPMHGGIVAIVKAQTLSSFAAAPLADWAKDGQPLLILDGIGNPHNLGAIARTAAFLGLKRIILSDHPQQAGLSDAAYRIAEGGISHIEFIRASDLPSALVKLRPYYRSLAATLSGRPVALPSLEASSKPSALVLGNEEDGLPQATESRCEVAVKIPGSGTVQSLNVSASAAILLYALRHMPARS